MPRRDVGDSCSSLENIKVQKYFSATEQPSARKKRKWSTEVRDFFNEKEYKSSHLEFSLSFFFALDSGARMGELARVSDLRETERQTEHWDCEGVIALQLSDRHHYSARSMRGSPAAPGFSLYSGAKSCELNTVNITHSGLSHDIHTTSKLCCTDPPWPLQPKCHTSQGGPIKVSHCSAQTMNVRVEAKLRLNQNHSNGKSRFIV